MYNFAISIAASMAVLFILNLGLKQPWWLSLIIALLVFAGAFLLISRLVMKKVMAAIETAGKDLHGQRVEKAIRELQSAFKYGKWQMYVTEQLNAQIGMIYFMKRDFSDAFPYLEKAFFKNWVAMGMLAVTYMKRNKKDKMKATFEKAVQWTGKESLLWNLYAYCLADCGDTDKAMEVLEKGLKKLPGDERITGNLEALREGKRMKMKSFGDMWLQFHLERPGTLMKQQVAAMGGMKRRIIRK
jgi:uncharacterized protein HemY